MSICSLEDSSDFAYLLVVELNEVVGNCSQAFVHSVANLGKSTVISACLGLLHLHQVALHLSDLRI